MPVTWTPEASIEAARRGALRGVTVGANIVRNEVLRLILRTTKSGRVYRRRGIEHQASAPGEAPASDTGTLVRQITVIVDPDTLTAKVNSGAAHAPHLEFGTEKMEPRPHMRVALENVRSQLEEAVARDISVEMRNTFGR